MNFLKSKVITSLVFVLLLLIVTATNVEAQQSPLNLSNNNGLSNTQFIAASGNNVYVIWMDKSLGNWEIFFKKSTDNGATFGNVINLSNSADFTSMPAIAASGNNVYVVWHDGISGDYNEIYFVKSTDNGNTFSAPKNLSNTSETSDNPQISISENNVYITWQEKISRSSSNPNSDIFFVKSTDGGATFSNPINVSNNAGLSSSFQMKTFGNSIYVVWRDTTDPVNGGIYFAKSTDNGNTFSSPKNVNNISGYSDYPYVAVSGNNVYVIWYTEVSGTPQTYFVKSTDNGNTFSTPKNLSKNPTDTRGMQIVASGNNVYVLMADFGPPASNMYEDVYFTKSTDGGATFSTPINLSNTPKQSSYPRMVTSGSDIYVVWSDGSYSAPNMEVLLVKSTDNGATFGSVTNLSNTSTQSAGVQIDLSGNNLYVSWTEVLSSQNYDVFLRTVTPPPPDTIPPVVTPPQNVIVQANSTSGTNVYYPQATATDNVGVTSGPTCMPSSGSIFQIGTTTVKCTVSDAAGNVGSATFTVTVTITDLVVSADKSTYNSGDVVVISGKGATGNTILIDILGFNSATIQELKVTATESGSFQTIWPVPVEIESGTYTIKVTDGTRTAKTTIQLKTSPSLGPEVLKIDSRFKNVANAWSETRISDKEFLQELQRWINSGLIVIQNMPKTTVGSSQEIPNWVRNNAGWWASNQIANADFAKAIEYLIHQGHLPLSVSSAACPECWEEKTETTVKVSVSPESRFYEGGDTVTIRGAITGYDRNDKTSVTVIILDPLDTIVSIAQVELDRDTGKYEAMFRASGPTWYLSGTYTIMAKYGSESAETTFQFTGEGTLTCRENQELVNGKCIDKEPTSDNSINVDGVKIISISTDLDFISLLLEVEVIGNPGILEITFDREYFDSTFEGMDEPFIVLADGNTSIFEETETTSETRTLRIELPTGTEEVEIIGSHLLDDTFDEIPIKEVPIEESEIVPEEEVPELDVDLDIFVNKSVFDLGDTVQIDVNLAGITNDEHVAIDIRDPTGSTVISRTLLVTPTMEEEMEFKIPEHFKTGTYQVTATVSISGKTFTDTASFKIESQFNQIRILSVEATNQQGNPASFTTGEMGFVKVTLDANKNIATLITVNLFDSELTSIGIGSVKTTLSSGQTEIILSFLIPEDTAKGDSDIFVNAFSDWPSQGGVPQTNEFSAKESVK